MNDRQTIRVGDQTSHAGIAAALRRAFAKPDTQCRGDDEFAHLLARLN